MPIPFFTSTITITRSRLGDLQDPYDPPSDQPTPTTKVVATGVKSVIKPPAANPNLSIGDRVVYDANLICEECDIREGDRVLDSYGRTWDVLGPSPWGAFFLSGMQATLRLVESFAE